MIRTQIQTMPAIHRWMKNATICLEIHTIDPSFAPPQDPARSRGCGNRSRNHMEKTYSISLDLPSNGETLTATRRATREHRLRCPNHYSLDLEIHDSKVLTTTSHKEESDRGGNTAIFLSSWDISIHDAEQARTGRDGRVDGTICYHFYADMRVVCHFSKACCFKNTLSTFKRK